MHRNVHGRSDTDSSLNELIEMRGSGLSSNRTYLEDARSERTISYKQLADAAKNWREEFERLGLVPGDAVLVDFFDPIVFGVVHLSLIAAGYRSIPVDPNSPWSELERLSNIMRSIRLIISDREEPGEIEGIPLIRATASDGTPVSLSTSHRRRSVASRHNIDHRGAVVIFTSGSTGVPKGVELPEAQLLYVARAIADHNKLQETDRGFNSLPLFHINGEVVGLLATLVAGATLVLDRRFHRSGFWELLADRQVTWLNAVPAILAILARSDTIDLPSSLRFIRSASAPLPDVIREAFDNIELVISYGMTEGASQITATPLGEPKRPGSVGVPVGNEIEVRDGQGGQLPALEVGTLWLRGAGIITHYLFGRASERFDAHGWLNTGDVGKIDEDGYVYLMGRSDDIINRGGEKLYPSEIEDVLLEDARVREVVVTAKPDDILGQVPVAYVIPAAENLDDKACQTLHDSLTRRCTQSLTHFKRPTAIVVVKDLPRAATGKIQRVRVREMQLTGKQGG